MNEKDKDFEIDLILDQLVDVLGTEPDGQILWAKTVSEVQEAIKPIIQDQLTKYGQAVREEVEKEFIDRIESYKVSESENICVRCHLKSLTKESSNKDNQ